MENKRQVIDDTLLYQPDVESSFNHTAKYLTLCGKNGIILNPAKFRFAQDEVEWAGVKLTKDGAAPLDVHVQAIRDFPAPQNATDMRSFWALVNQVAPYYAVQPHLLPFRDLMKKNSLWYWDGPLQRLFEETKVVIAQEVTNGITRYDIDRWTSLLTDWSKTGVGFTMSQKYCDCPEINPICCSSGWKTCMVGSNFLSPAEAKYAPIEGECLGVVNALYKTRYYTQGCDKLVIGTDHKPLVPVLESKNLEDISNPRLLRLKEKTYGWRFKSMHIPGRKLGGPDALSRHTAEPDAGTAESCKEVRQSVLASIREVSDVSISTPDPELHLEECLLAAVHCGVRSITWDLVKKELGTDDDFFKLSTWIQEGCLGGIEELPELIKPYFKFRSQLRCVDGVPMFANRTIIPKHLRREVLSTLHSAHQGTLAMGLRAEQVVYWPGMWADINRVREKCDICHRIAPSQSNLPPVEPIVPDYPFQHVAVDYMTIEGENYGVFVDRYSGWPGMICGTQAKDVVSFLASLCQSYGCPETITTDGAPNLTAKVVEDMLKVYGIKHRISSVANPHANSRAELGVKTVKRMLRDCVGKFGKLDGPRFSRALLTLRNTPDRDTRLSPAACLFGRPMRDFLPTQKGQLMGEMWQDLANKREQALARRSTKIATRLNQNAKRLQPLQTGTSVFIQNQLGNYPKRWDRRGVVVSDEGYDQYLVRVDGSRRVTCRNRKYLKPFVPYKPSDIVHCDDLNRGGGDMRINNPSIHVSRPDPTPTVVPRGITGCDNVGKPVIGLESQQVGSENPTEQPTSPLREANDQSVKPVDVQPPTSPVTPDSRRSTRAGRGTTSRFDEYVRD